MTAETVTNPTKSTRFKSANDLLIAFNDLRSNRKEHEIDEMKKYTREYDRKSYSPSKGKPAEPNHGKFRAQVESKLKDYIDVITERSRWARIRTLVGETEEERSFYSRAITDAFHNYCIRLWKDRATSTYEDVRDMLLFSKGHEWNRTKAGVFPENVGAERVFVNKDAGLHSKNWDLCFVVSSMTYLQLYEEATHEARAKVEGWNLKAVTDLILHNNSQLTETDDDLLKEFREGRNSSICPDESVEVIYAYVKEYSPKDGKRISRYIITEPVPRTNDTLESRKSRNDKMAYLSKKPFFEVDMSMIINIRTNVIASKYSKGSVSFASQIYFPSVFDNKNTNRVIRSVLRNVHLFLATDSPDQKSKLSKIDADDEVTILDPDTKVVQQAVNINWPGLMEVIRQVDQNHKAQNRDPLATGSQNVKGGAITAQESKLNAGVSIAALDAEQRIFNISDSNLLQCIYRRFSDKNRIIDPLIKRGRKIFEQELERKGVPVEAYSNLDLMTISSITEFGSMSRSDKFQLTEMLLSAIRKYTASGTEGERRAAIDQVASIVGRDQVEYYLPAKAEQTESLSEIFLIGSENSDLGNPYLNTKNVQVNPEKNNHPLHIEFHLGDIEHSLEMATILMDQSEQSTPIESQTLLNEAKSILVATDNKGGHIEAHLAVLESAASNIKDAAEISKMARGRLKQLQSTEAEAEARYGKLIEAHRQNAQQNQFLSVKEQHETRMMDLEFEHAQNMNNLALTKTVQQGEVNRSGKDENHAQKLRHEEQKQQLERANEAKKQERDTSGSVGPESPQSNRGNSGV